MDFFKCMGFFWHYDHHGPPIHLLFSIKYLLLISNHSLSVTGNDIPLCTVHEMDKDKLKIGKTNLQNWNYNLYD